MIKSNPGLAQKIITMVPILAIVFFSGCEQPGSPKAGDKKSPPAHLVNVIEAKAQPVATTHTRTGTLTIRHLARIHAQEEGRITAFPWLEGDTVKQGTLLISLDDALLQAELKKSQADARQAELDLKRLKNLIKKKAASEEVLNRAQTNVSISRAEVEILKTRLTYTRILAPFDGVVSERLVEAEDFVSKQDHLLTLINPASLYVQASISELLLPQLSTEAAVEIQIDALGQQSFSGKIERIHPAIDPQTRQAVIEVSFEQLPDNIRSGQFARLQLKTRAIPRILLPFNAIQHDRNGEFVYRLEDGKAIKTRIRSGIKIADQIEVLEGIHAGQQIIIQGFLGLSDGKPVKLKPAGN